MCVDCSQVYLCSSTLAMDTYLQIKPTKLLGSCKQTALTCQRRKFMPELKQKASVITRGQEHIYLQDSEMVTVLQ